LSAETQAVRNVAGYLAGETAEYVVIGAHYDHIGLGQEFSMAPGSYGMIHPGADDNASGTAGVIELARWFGSRERLHRGLLFLTFAGEEIGLLGSSHWVNNSPLAMSHAVAMINLDMIGRIRAGKVYVGGLSTGTTLRRILEEQLPFEGLDLDFSDVVDYGSSDHASFMSVEVPVLTFFSGLHGDYHRPADTWEKVDAGQAARLLDYIARIVEELASERPRPEFVRYGEAEATSGEKPNGRAPL
jgi:Zn-dependent M28 family amino/carboxypeptidase